MLRRGIRDGEQSCSSSAAYLVGYVRKPLNASQEKNPKIKGMDEVVMRPDRLRLSSLLMGRIPCFQEGFFGDWSMKLGKNLVEPAGMTLICFGQSRFARVRVASLRKRPGHRGMDHE